MGIQSTVVFADLFGSTGVFESLGNVKATEAVTTATNWVAERITASGGRVVKFLGDGVLAIFKSSNTAITSVIDIQRSYQLRFASQDPAFYMPLRIGVVRGDVEIVENDCYGDAVNIAARLSELTGPNQIWVNNHALVNCKDLEQVRFRSLGPISLRGRTEPCLVSQVEWQEDINSEFFTVPASMNSTFSPDGMDFLGAQIELSWIDNHKTFNSFDMPIQLGRARELEFVVSDPRVSRTHARIEWRNGSMVLVDVSSYGCWVRFSGDGAGVTLRREECVLHGKGEIALGSPFSDFMATVVAFSLI
jgi:class 3 adenylate cyclase